jgi:hypothetical protein
MGARYPHPVPAHSNPNLPDSSQKHCNVVALQRSSSHPPEIFCWGNNEPVLRANINVTSDEETQTGMDLLEQFILLNRRRVLAILGLDADAILGSQTVPSNSTAKTRNRCGNKVTSVPQPTDWIPQLPPAPSFCHQKHHRFSAGDIDDKFPAIGPLPTTRSLKFQPFAS